MLVCSKVRGVKTVFEVLLYLFLGLPTLAAVGGTQASEAHTGLLRNLSCLRYIGVTMQLQYLFSMAAVFVLCFGLSASTGVASLEQGLVCLLTCSHLTGLTSDILHTTVIPGVDGLAQLEGAACRQHAPCCQPCVSIWL